MICTNVDSDALADDSTGNNSNAELITITTSNSDSTNNINTTPNEEDSSNNINNNNNKPEERSTNSSSISALDADLCNLNSTCDNNLIDSNLNRDFILYSNFRPSDPPPPPPSPSPPPQSLSTVSASMTRNKSKAKTKIIKPDLPYRYTGQFTEKFYRSQSQPSIFDKLNSIDHKLKTRKPLHTVRSTDLPFVDCMDEDNHFKLEHKIKLTQAPFAKIDDV